MSVMEDFRSEKIVASSCKMAVNEQRKQKKKEVCESILCELRQCDDGVMTTPAFAEELQSHFDRLPTRYALYVHTDRADDVLIHKRLLDEVKESNGNSVLHVCAVPARKGSAEPANKPFHPDDAVEDPPMANLKLQLPAMASSWNHETLASELNSPLERTEEGSQHSQSSTYVANLPMHEVTISSIDKPKLLSQLSALLADVGLNIREAHVFSTTDGYSLDVFVADGWPTEDTEDLKQALTQAISTVKEAQMSGLEAEDAEHSSSPELSDGGWRPGSDDWEIDSCQLKFVRKLTTGSSGDLYLGSYCGQDVAIKVLKAERMNDCLKLEFQQELFVMRKVRHKNIVQFIGACTKPPNFCIVTEYMSGGSVYDYLHQQKAALKMPMLLRVAIDVSKGMDYLHQNQIIHRDLKAANLLMDDNEVVKVADFGVARVQAQSGIMTAETGTYRWMAPEVIEHKPYDSKADVFSFGIVLWELLTGQVPYEDLTPLQAAVGVVKKGLRPTVPEDVDPTLNDLLQRCWNTDPSDRPNFSQITGLLEEILKQVNRDAESGTRKNKDKKLAGLFAAFKRSPAL